MGRKRKLVNCKIKKCNGKYQVEYSQEAGAPIFICDACGDKDNSWELFYFDYMSRYKDVDNWSKKDEILSCVLGFFLHLYEKKYGIKYAFVPSSRNPFSSKEVRDSWKLISAFNGDGHLIGRYMRWVFSSVVRDSTSIFSFNYLNSPGLIRKFMLKHKNKNKLRRDSKIPKDVVKWVGDNLPVIIEKYEFETMNDFASIVAYFKSDPSNESIASLIKYAESKKIVKDGSILFDAEAK